MTERGKLTQSQAFRKQCLSKLVQIEDLDKQKAKYVKDILEYVTQLERYGFEFDGGEPKDKKPVGTGRTVPTPPRRMASAPIDEGVDL